VHPNRPTRLLFNTNACASTQPGGNRICRDWPGGVPTLADTSPTASGAMFSLGPRDQAVVRGLLPRRRSMPADTIGARTISFGMLDIVNIAHRLIMLVGYCRLTSSTRIFRSRPVLIGVRMARVLSARMAVFRFNITPSRQRARIAIQGLAFFFGLLFVGDGRADQSLSSWRLRDYSRFVKAPISARPACRLAIAASGWLDPVSGVRLLC